MPKHYEVEYEVHTMVMDTVYDVDNKEEAINKVFADLRENPLPLDSMDVTFTSFKEIDYETGLPKKENNKICPECEGSNLNEDATKCFDCQRKDYE